MDSGGQYEDGTDRHHPYNCSGAVDGSDEEGLYDGAESESEFGDGPFFQKERQAPSWIRWRESLFGSEAWISTTEPVMVWDIFSAFMRVPIESSPRGGDWPILPGMITTDEPTQRSTDTVFVWKTNFSA